MYKLKINDTSYNLEQGFILTEIFNENLDNGVIKIPFNDKINLECFNEVEILENDVTLKKYYVGTFIETQVGFGSEHEKFDYIINLISKTIKLQKMPLPNFTVTKSLIDKPHSIFYHLQRLVNVYNDLTLSQNLKNKTQDIEASEFALNKPTVFEVCNELLLQIDCVININLNGELDYLELNKKSSDINPNNFNFIRKTKNIEEYAESLEVEISNLISENGLASVKNFTPRSSNSYILDTKNLKLILPNSILRIKNAKVKYNFDNLNSYLRVNYWDNGYQTYDFNGFVEVDITDHILQNDIFEIKKIANTPNIQMVEEYDVNGEVKFRKNLSALDYKRLNISYNKNFIENITFTEKNLLGWSVEQNSIENIFLWKALDDPNVKDVFTLDESGVVGECRIEEFRDLIFEVEYEILDTVVCRFNKSENATKESITLIDNQQSSFVNFSSYCKSEQNKINRLGNFELLISATYTNFADIPKISETYKDYVITQTTIAFENGFFNVEILLNKNFVRNNLFTALKMGIRYFSYASSNDSYLRLDHKYLDFVMSESQGTKDTLCDKMFMARNEHLVYGVETIKSNNETIGTFFVEPTVNCVKNNEMLLTYKMIDNISAGISVDTTRSLGGYGQYNNLYVDHNGEFLNRKFYFIFDYAFGETNEELLTTSYEYPKIQPNKLNDYTTILDTKNKDNREILAESLQFRMFKDSVNIFLFDIFKLTMFFNKNKVFKIYTSKDLMYNNDSTSPLGEFNILNEIIINNNTITLSSPETDIVSWCVCDIDNNLIIGVNEIKKIYLNRR